MLLTISGGKNVGNIGLVKKPWQNMEFSAERYIPRFTSVVFQAPEMVTSSMSYLWLVVLDGGVDMTSFTLVILIMLNRSRALRFSVGLLKSVSQ